MDLFELGSWYFCTSPAKKRQKTRRRDVNCHAREASVYANESYAIVGLFGCAVIKKSLALLLVLVSFWTLLTCLGLLKGCFLWEPAESNVVLGGVLCDHVVLP